jgi:hypothetical protein
MRVSAVSSVKLAAGTQHEVSYRAALSLEGG